MVFFILSHRQIIGNSACFSRSSRSTRLHFIHYFQNHVLGFSEVASDAKKRNYPLSRGFGYTEQTAEVGRGQCNWRCSVALQIVFR